jgi:hypothetical protein
MRPTFFPSQNPREDNFWKEIGRLKEGAHLASLDLINTLVSHSLYHRNGNGFVAATLGTPAFQRSIGLQLILHSELCSCTENCTCQSSGRRRQNPIRRPRLLLLAQPRTNRSEHCRRDDRRRRQMAPQRQISRFTSLQVRADYTNS